MADTTDDRKATAPVEVTAAEAKGSFGELLSRAGFGNERIAISKHGRRVAALVSIEDLERLQGAA